MRLRLAILLATMACLAASAWADVPYWALTVKQVHDHFTGTPGTVSRLGDSISVSMAFFVPLQYAPANAGSAAAASTWIRSYVPSNVWHWQDDNQGIGDATADDWKYRGALGGTEAGWALQRDGWPGQLAGEDNLGYWLRTMNPEMGVIMWGTNDIRHGVAQSTVINNLSTILDRVKANGTVPLLTTAPPQRSYSTQMANLATAVTSLAQTKGVPLIDYYGAVMTRRPGTTWDGTLISSDGIHPSNTSPTNDFSATALSNNGYTLRNYVTLLGMYDTNNILVIKKGDADFDRDVDFADYQVLETNFGRGAGYDWYDGDFDFDGDVDFADYQKLESNFGSHVPEPASLVLFLAGTLVLRRRRTYTTS